MNPLVAILTLALAWLALSTDAYGIDSSCKDQDFIQASADAAIDMAAKAVEAIDPPDNTDRDPNVDRLLDLLFRGSGSLDAAQDSDLINSIKEVYRGVAKFGIRKDITQPGSDPSTADEVVSAPLYFRLDRR